MNGLADTRPPLLEISDAQWLIVQGILQTQLPNREVWAFGSRATARAKPYSDLDLAVIGDEAMPLSLSAALSEAFTESDLPWKVDVLDWASTSASFREIIRRDRIVLQAGPAPTSA